jgi:hypothetical protein
MDVLISSFLLQPRIEQPERGRSPALLYSRHTSDQAYIEAADGTFLGKLNPNQYDSDSIFNE